MNLSKCIDFLNYPFSGQARRRVRERRKQIKLIMTLVVKNEEDIIEQNIRFHHAMGVDGFIVTAHNCTDKTNEILERLRDEGLVLHIFYETTPDHKLNVWVARMVELATRKYHTNWMINADADEFYYSKSFNLKESIAKSSAGVANVLWVDSLFLFPDDRADFLNCPYFVTNPFTKFKAQELKIDTDTLFEDFIGSQGCTKVIHKTSGHPKPQKGNHTIIIDNPVVIESADIKLFHFHIQNYKKYEAKVKRWIEPVKYKPAGEGEHLKHMVALYQNGKLRDEYDRKYGTEMREFLIENGVVTRDLSVSDFMRYQGII